MKKALIMWVCFCFLFVVAESVQAEYSAEIMQLFKEGKSVEAYKLIQEDLKKEKEEEKKEQSEKRTKEVEAYNLLRQKIDKEKKDKRRHEKEKWEKEQAERDAARKERELEIANASYIDDAFHKDILSLFRKYKDAAVLNYTVLGSNKFAIANMEVVFRPPFKVDNKVYLVMGVMEGVDGDRYIVKAKKSSKRFFFKNKTETERGKKAADNLKVNGEVAIYGRFVESVSYVNLVGGKMTAPLFEAYHIEDCNYINTHKTIRCKTS